MNELSIYFFVLIMLKPILVKLNTPFKLKLIKILKHLILNLKIFINLINLYLHNCFKFRLIY